MPERRTRRNKAQGNPIEQTSQSAHAGDHPLPPEEVLRSIVTSTSTARTGAEFFAQLTRSLARALSVRYAFVGEAISPEQPTRVRTMAVCDCGTIVDNIEYDLTGTPCEGVVGGKPVLYAAGVRQRFPDDPLLVEMNVESYFGVPLIDSENQLIGLLVAMHDQPLPDSELVRSILSTFAARAAAELSRLKTENILRESESHFRTILDTVDHIIWLAAPDGSRTLYINRAAEQVYGRPVADFYANSQLWLQAVYPPDRATVEKSAKNLDDLGRTETEYRIVRPDGAIRWLLHREFIVRDCMGRPVHRAGAAIDITERKLVEQRLDQLGCDKRLILDSSSDLIVYQDPNQRILWANREAGRSVNRNPEELVGRFCYDIWHDRTEPCDKCPVRKALETGTSHEEVIHSPDGRVWWIRGFPVCDDKGRVTGATEFTLDITEQKRAEQKLQESEQRLRTLFEHAPEAAVIIDTDTGCFVDANDNATQLFGLDREALCRVGPAEMSPPHQPDGRPSDIAAQESIQKALLGRTPHFEWVHRNAQGRDIPCEIRLVRLPAAERNLVRGSVTDLTERTRTERALRESRALLEATLESTADGILVVDDSGKVIHTNRRFAEIWQIPDALLQMRDDDKLLAFVLDQLADPDAFLTKVRELYRSTREDLDTLHFKDGRLFERYSRPLMRENDTAGRVWSFRDVTERVRHQKELTRARRLETAGQLAGQIAHDFNNLLGPLAAYPEMARRHLPPDSDVHRMLDIIETCATRMADINQQLLTLSRRGHYRVEPLDLNTIIEETLQSASMPTTVVINTELDPELFPCKGGKAQIQRVLVNLLNNAREAIDGVGQIDTRTDNVYLDGPLTRHRRIRKGEYIRIRITDNGAGIPPEVIDRIFDPFFTTKTTDKHRGTGLGLSIVHSVIEDHDGYVDIDSTPGCGTTVSLYFPICRETVNQEPTPSEVPHGTGQRVLVVDDDPTQCQVAQDSLTELGYVVTTAASGEEAVLLAEETSFDILVLDMVMDGIDGVETLRRIRASRPDQAAVLLSGYATSERVAEAVELGIEDILAKPVRIPTLAVAIHRALQETTPAESPSCQPPVGQAVE